MRDYLRDSILSFWYKYCGVSDEYKTLKSKWTFLADKYKPILPDLKETFDVLDKQIEELDRLFRSLELKRENSDEEPKVDLNIFNTIKNLLFEISVYLGFLKLAFFQRTVSLEIPRLEIGLPQSPERTIGNEMFYVAADRIAEAYVSCLNINKVKWDGFVTFVFPITFSSFPGAIFRPSRTFPLFHVSMSEEQKYFMGSYLYLAHEVSHGAIYEHPESFLEIVEYVLRTTDKDMVEYQTNLLNFSEETKKIAALKKCCDCEYSYILQKATVKIDKLDYEYPVKNIIYSCKDILEEVLADLIAIKIGGIHTLTATFNEICDLFYTLLRYNGKLVPKLLLGQSTVRFYGVLEYLCNTGQKPDTLEKLEHNFKEMLNKTKNHIEQNSEELMLIEKVCKPCLIKLGKTWGEKIAELDKYTISETGKSVFSKFVRDDKFFEYTDDEVTSVRDKIVNGETVPTEDPRLILHAYYDALTNGLYPNFTATLYSIIYNTYRSTD